MHAFTQKSAKFFQDQSDLRKRARFWLYSLPGRLLHPVRLKACAIPSPTARLVDTFRLSPCVSTCASHDHYLPQQVDLCVNLLCLVLFAAVPIAINRVNLMDAAEGVKSERRERSLVWSPTFHKRASLGTRL
jgi:hypothetical protein